MLVVLAVVITAGLLAAAGLDTGRAVSSASVFTRTTVSDRLLAEAGVRAYAEELLAMRDDLLLGKDAELSEELDLWETEGGDRAYARLLPLDASGALVVSEAAKLDVNLATEGQLAALLALEPGLASRIVRDRPRGGFASVYDLLAIDGVSPDRFFGDNAVLTRPWAADPEIGQEAAGGLFDLLAVHAAEPNTRTLNEEGEADPTNIQRLLLGGSWNDELEREVRSRYGDDVTAIVRSSVERGAFATDAAFVRTLVGFRLDPSDWALPMDLFSPSPDPYLVGRIDLMRAPEAVLAAMPGATADFAATVATEREAIEGAEALSPTWLAARGVVTNSEYEQLASSVAIRSLQWRVRIETGRTSESSGFDELAVGGETQGGETRGVRITEVVIDLAAPRPRIAEMIDLTDRPLVARFLTSGEGESQDLDSDEAEPGVERSDTDVRSPAFDLFSGDEFQLAGPDRSRDVREEAPARSSGSGSVGAPAAKDARRGRWTPGGTSAQTTDEDTSQ